MSSVADECEDDFTEETRNPRVGDTTRTGTKNEREKKREGDRESMAKRMTWFSPTFHDVSERLQRGHGGDDECRD